MKAPRGITIGLSRCSFRVNPDPTAEPWGSPGQGRQVNSEHEERPLRGHRRHRRLFGVSRGAVAQVSDGERAARCAGQGADGRTHTTNRGWQA
jgi:hypothetical protein